MSAEQGTLTPWLSNHLAASTTDKIKSKKKK
jgi:hypothetical protein